MARDRHIRRTGSDYAHALASLLPTGIAWPRQPGSVLQRVVLGLANYWGFVDRRAAEFLEIESDPRTTNEMLTDWERAFGLPDPCLEETLTVAARRKMLVQRMTMIGEQSREFFTEVAAELGHDIIAIRERSPFMCGISHIGDTRTGWHPDWPDAWRWHIGSPGLRAFWTVKIGARSLMWFRAASGQAGVDPMVRIGLETDLECLLNRWKPGHSIVLFDYSEATPWAALEVVVPSATLRFESVGPSQPLIVVLNHIISPPAAQLSLTPMIVLGPLS